jgi:hypothetical protein
MSPEPPTNSGISKRTKKIIFGIVITIFCIPILLVLAFFALWFFHPNVTLHRADAGFRKAKQTIDPEQLRAWALEEIAKNPTNDGIFPPKIPNAEIPSYMQKLYSQPVEDAVIWKFAGNTNFALLTLHSNSVEQLGQTNVTIFWGGPFFHWMFEIGPTNFVPSPDSYVTTAEWVPGIYYGRENTVDPIK